MGKSFSFNPNYFLLYVPWGLSLLFAESANTSYLVAWAGSFWIFFLSMTGRIRPIPADLPLSGQLMRPLFITQIIFAGYLAVSSIFYFLEGNGFYFLTYQEMHLPDLTRQNLTAQCQRYYCLAHATFTTGILLGMKYAEKPAYAVEVPGYSAFMLRLTVWFTVLAFLTGVIPGFNQFAIKIKELSFVASVLCLALSIPEKKTNAIVVGLSVFTFNMLLAFLSGWKEQIIVPLIMLGTFLYPYYKKTVLVVMPALLTVFFVFVPSYINTFRGMAWSGDTDAQTASQAALAAIQSGEVDLEATNWMFLTGRLSEIGMFVTYVERVPRDVDFYGLTLVFQAVESMVPRIFWPNKANVEELVMQRVREIGVISELSAVSAKPPLITDGYLSGGVFGIFLLALALGYAASRISVVAENMFGGYLLGTALVYTGLFQIFWRGNCFEFMLNSVFWSYVLMYLLFYVGIKTGVVMKTNIIPSTPF